MRPASPRAITIARTLRRAGFTLALVAAPAGFAQAQSGAPLRIGQTVALSGGMAEHGRALQEGARLYVERVNRNGGIGGRMVALTTLDDGGDAKRAVDNARRLVTEDQVLALFSGAEGGPCVAVTAAARDWRVPVIGCAGGSPELREPFNPMSFPVRAAHLDEFGKLIQYAALFGGRRIAFVHSDSATGRAHLANLRRVAAEQGAEVVLALPLPGSNAAFDPARMAAEIAKSRADVVLNHGSYAQYADIVRILRRLDAPPQVLAVNSGAQQMVRLLGRDAPGLIFSQVVPFPWFDVTPVVKEYRAAIAAATPPGAPSFSGLEGHVNAKVLVEALRRAGPKVTRETLAAALESLASYDVGGMTVRFRDQAREGSRFVDVVVVAADGRFVR